MLLCDNSVQAPEEFKQLWYSFTQHFQGKHPCCCRASKMKVHQSTDCFCSGWVNYAAVWEVKDMRVRVTVVWNSNTLKGYMT